MSFGDSLLVALFVFAVVFFALFCLYVLIRLFSVFVRYLERHMKSNRSQSKA